MIPRKVNRHLELESMSTAQIPVCSACESNLRQLGGEWVCLVSGCPRYGHEQYVETPSSRQTYEGDRTTVDPFLDE